MKHFNITSVHFDNLSIAIGELLKLPGVVKVYNIEGDEHDAGRFTILCGMADGRSIYHDVECFGEGYFEVTNTH